jgi:hypothetical protein
MAAPPEVREYLSEVIVWSLLYATVESADVERLEDRLNDAGGVAAFTAFDLQLVDRATVHRWFKACLGRAGLPTTIKIHELRHSAADNLWRTSGNLTDDCGLPASDPRRPGGRAGGPRWLRASVAL